MVAATPPVRLPSLIQPGSSVKIGFKSGELIHDFFNGDVKWALRSIARFELQEQIILGNDKFVLRVDGSQNKNLSLADRRVEANFIDESVPLALQQVYQVIYQQAYNPSTGVKHRTGMLGSYIIVTFNGKVISSVSQIKSLTVTDKVVFWLAAPYSHLMSRYIAGKLPRKKPRKAKPGARARPVKPVPKGQSLIVRIRKALQGNRLFTGIQFRALDLPKPGGKVVLGDGLLRKRAVAIRITLTATRSLRQKQLFTINPSNPGVLH